MGDIVDVTPTSSKANGPSSIQCPMLNSANYTVWSIRMKIILKVHKVWETIEGESNDTDKNNLAIALIFQSIPETLILQVGELDKSKAVWEAIKSRHVGAERVKEARLQTLMADFDRMKMTDTDSIDDFVGKLSELSSKAAALGESIEEAKVVKKFLNSLPRKKYIHMVASLEQVLDLNKTSFEDIVGRLKAYEERICEEEDQQEDQGKLMYAMETQSFRDHNGENRGRGRGGRFYGRGGRGRGWFDYQNYQTQYFDNQSQAYRQGKDKSKIVCFRCDKPGHYASVCPDRLLKLQETQENTDTQDADELMMHEVVYLNKKNFVPNKQETPLDMDDIWYLDNGASNHITGVKSYFSELNESIKGNGDDTQDVILDFDMHFETQAKPVMECWHGSNETEELLSSHEGKEESENGEEVKEIEQNEDATSTTARNEDATSAEATPDSCHEDDSRLNADVVQREIDADVREAATKDDDIDMLNDEIDGEVSIGTDISDHDIFNEDIQSANELLDSYPNNVPKDPSTSSPNVNNDENHVSKKEEEDLLEFKTLSIETTERPPNGYFSQHHEFEEEKVLPDTPTSIENFHQLYNRMLHIQRRESDTEASMDGSAVNDIDCGDGVLTIEKLKSMLRIEREALNRVCAELEEERSAFAIAASQTMAMINRIQEEKAAMQMEALQYQRMMDEQSKYDQEAIQLLNEFMVKREKEKQELELGIYRKKVQDYEAKEKMMILRRMREGCARSRISSGPCRCRLKWWILLTILTGMLRLELGTHENHGTSQEDERVARSSDEELEEENNEVREWRHEFKTRMATKFEMSDLERLTYYLGIEIHQHETGITLKQNRYALKILEEAGMEGCNVTQVPMDSGLKLSKAQEELDTKGRELKKLQKLKEFKPTMVLSILAAKKDKKKTDHETKRPSPPYVIWCKDQWNQVKQENPHAEFKDISAILGVTWKIVTSEEKRLYEEKYQAEKEAYLQVMAKEKRETEAMHLFEEEHKQKTAMELLEQYMQFKEDAEKDPLKPKKLVTAFFLFTNERRAALNAQNIKSVLEVARITGEEWKNMTDKQKGPYEEMARKNKEKYAQEMEAYKQHKEEEAALLKKEEEEIMKLQKFEALLKKKEKTDNRTKYKEMRDLIGVQELSKEEFKLKWENVGLSLKKACPQIVKS